MSIQIHDIQPGAVFSNCNDEVLVMRNAGLQTGLRLDQFPSNGLVYAPWFRTERDVADFLNLGGHIRGAPFQQVQH